MTNEKNFKKPYNQAERDYGYYSRVLNKPFDSIEELREAEAAYRAEEALELGEIQFVPAEKHIAVVNMIAQGLVGSVPLRYYALGACLQKLYRIADEHKYQIYMPKIGAGLACGDWTFILRMIEECAEYYGVNTTIFEL